jgi:hypothetical protein
MALLLGGVTIVVGSILPWVEIDDGFVDHQVSGLDRGGRFTIGLGIVIALIALVMIRRSGPSTSVFLVSLVALASVVCGIVAVHDARHADEAIALIAERTVSDVFVSDVFAISAGPGWFVVLAGVATSLVGFVRALHDHRHAVAMTTRQA